jgi:hypothetical protein
MTEGLGLEKPRLDRIKIAPGRSQPKYAVFGAVPGSAHLSLMGPRKQR